LLKKRKDKEFKGKPTMPIITISRGSYSKGKEVAEKLAQALRYDCVSRDILLEASDEFNIPEIKLVRALHDAPSVLERFTNGKERYLCYIRSAILNHVIKDNVVYHGLAGHYFLRSVPHVLKVRIIGNIEARIQEEMTREKISEAEARYILKKDDEERRKWGLQVYGMDTWDSSLYDVVLHIGTLTVNDAVDILCAIVNKPGFQKTPASEKILKDLALSAKVLSSLVNMVPKIDVKANDGTVVIVTPGLLPNSTVNELSTIAENVEGVTKVIISVPSSREQQDHINPFHNIG
jgi:cytidylate kinase